VVWVFGGWGCVDAMSCIDRAEMRDELRRIDEAA